MSNCQSMIMAPKDQPTYFVNKGALRCRTVGVRDEQSWIAAYLEWGA